MINKAVKTISAFLQAQSGEIMDTTEPRIVKISAWGGDDHCYVLATSEEKLGSHVFSFVHDEWSSRESFDAEWEFGAYNVGDYPEGGYKEHHEVYALAKQYGFNIAPLDITIETVIADIRDELKE